MTHQPIRIRTQLHTSVKLGRFPVSLDGLLWHTLFLRAGNQEQAKVGLKALLAEDQGIFRASSMGFGVYPNERPLIATQTPTIGVMRPDTDLLPEQFHPTGKKGKYTKLLVEGGPYKNRLNKHKTYHAPEVYWDAVGDGDAICDLLNFYVISIGLEANRGFGSVGRFRWEVMEHDLSWQVDGATLARVLPEYIANNILDCDIDDRLRVMAQTTPPYRMNALTPCVMPPVIRRAPLTKQI